jgi:hypothetical protein
MQEGIGGAWVQQSHVSREHLNSVRGLNQHFLDLVGTSGGKWRESPKVRACTQPPHQSSARQLSLCEILSQQLEPLSRTQRAAAANCPYALFDLRFEDDRYWKLRLQDAGPLQVADEPMTDGDTISFVQLALFYAWHVASAAGLSAQLLLGMCSETAAAFRRITVNHLPALVASEAANLTARWSDCPAYWNALTSAASRADPQALRRVQLSGLQLAAAARLPRAG